MRIFLFLLLGFPFTALSQETKLYEANGVLKADKHYRINNSAAIKAAAIENQLMPWLSKNLRYPMHAADNDLSGHLILEFSKKNGAVTYKVVKFSNKLFKKAILDFLTIQNSDKLQEVFSGINNITFYLPIEFVLIIDDKNDRNPPNVLVVKMYKSTSVKI